MRQITLQRMQTLRSAPVPLLSRCVFFCTAACFYLSLPAHAAATPKSHTVTLGSARRVPYLPADAPAPTSPEDGLALKIRPLLVDGRQKEWTTGDAHDVTDRSFTVRRALRLNDALPGDAAAHWIWQPGPWLLVDRTTGRVTALRLPEFDPIVSQIVWFRDYAAYCGIATTAKGGLLAIVAQIGARKAIVQKQIAPWPQAEHPTPVCQPAQWERQPMRVTLQLTGGQPLVFDVVGSAALVEEGENEEL
jgi:hypothetical protein